MITIVSTGTSKAKALGALVVASALTAGVLATWAQPAKASQVNAAASSSSHARPHADLPAPSDALAAPAAESPPYALDQTFVLHSRPAASHKIFLDFTGHTTNGTRWNGYYTGGNPIVSAPYNDDGVAGYSTTEQAIIQRTYLRVREDFAPFDVDVTTQDPGVEALRKTSVDDTAYGQRVVFSPTNFLGGNSPGVAFVGTFGDATDTPAFAFTSLARSHKLLGEVGAHELGHTLGLSHDGTVPSATPVGGDPEYYWGQGNWAPILGSSYTKVITQWSKGEYAGANNGEDDLAVITSHGLSYRPDDVVGSADTSATLPAGIHRYGVIGRTGDVDAYKFSLNSAHTVRIKGWNNAGGVDPNLNLRATLKTSTGTLKVTAAPTSSTGFDFTVSLPPGVYVLYVTGGGEGSPTDTGYSNYGSLGHYGTVLNWA